MGKQNRKKTIKNKNKNKTPLVSVCTPTFNRRPFFEGIIQCYLNQDYPSDKMEWIIVDDGTDPIGDVVKDIPGVKYYYYKEKMPLGRKRNLMHEKATGDIIVYMDDDDYYPPTRVSHAVKTLMGSKKLMAGSTVMYMWLECYKKMYRVGPYGDNHATAGTFAFKKELLKQTGYEDGDNAAFAEERFFLKDYSIPLIQLDPKHTILVLSHIHNTFDKKQLVDGRNSFIKESSFKLTEFLKDETMKTFYTEKINSLLEDYTLGRVEHKKDVVKKLKEKEDEYINIMSIDESGNERVLKKKEIADLMINLQEEVKNLRNNQMTMTDSCGNKRVLEGHEILNIINGLKQENKELREKLESLQQK